MERSISNRRSKFNPSAKLSSIAPERGHFAFPNKRELFMSDISSLQKQAEDAEDFASACESERDEARTKLVKAQAELAIVEAQLLSIHVLVDVVREAMLLLEVPWYIRWFSFRYRQRLASVKGEALALICKTGTSTRCKEDGSELSTFRPDGSDI